MSRYHPKKEIRFETPEEERRAAVSKAMNLLLYRDRSRTELIRRLEEAGFSGAAVSEAVSYVEDYGYLNDRRFAETYAAVHGEKKSRSLIRLELLEKGVAEEDIAHALEAVEKDEESLACELLGRRAGAPHLLDEREKRRLYSYLARKGFPSSVIWRAIRKYLDTSA